MLLLASAAAYALSFPPWNLWALCFIALIPLLRALDALSAGRAALAGLAWGTLAIWGVGWWVPAAIASYYDQPVWFGILFSAAASVVFAGSYAAGFAACAAIVARRPRSASARVLLLTAVWVAWELARARLLSGDPWLLLGYALVPATSLAQLADVGGVYLLSAVIFACNAALAELYALLAGRRGDGAPGAAARRSVGVLAALAVAPLVAAWTYGVARLGDLVPTAPPVPVSIVQGNNGIGAQWRSEFYGRGLEHYLTLSARSAQASGARLIFWPESAITFFLEEESAYRASIAHVLGATGAEIVLGGPHHEATAGDPERYFNSAFLLSPSGEVRGRYDKRKLLPFAEYFPLRTIEFLRRHFERVRWFTAGDRDVALDTGAGRAAVAICFEAIFPELIRARMADGAHFLVNLSNDAWLGHGPGPEQHFLMVRLRAIENRTWIVRATTTGVTALVDPQGRVAARAPSGVAATLEGTIVPRASGTVYQGIGDLLAYACVLVTVLTVVAGVVRRR